MRVGMARMDLTRRLDAHRVLSLTVSFLALVGWGAFAYSVGSSASAERDLRAELAQSKAAQDHFRPSGTNNRRRSGNSPRSKPSSCQPATNWIPLLRNG